MSYDDFLREQGCASQEEYELKELKDINAELLAALKNFVAAAERGAIWYSEQKGGCLRQARAAIAKATK